MIKTMAITLVGAGIIGTGTQTLPTEAVAPKALEITAGTVVYEIGSQGLETKVATTPGFALTIRLVKDRTFTLKF